MSAYRVILPEISDTLLVISLRISVVGPEGCLMNISQYRTHMCVGLEGEVGVHGRVPESLEELGINPLSPDPVVVCFHPRFDPRAVEVH